MTTQDIVLTIVTTLNVLTVIFNIVALLKMSDREADIITAEKTLITPVATIKAEFSEEDMKKIKEMLEEANKHKFVMKQAESEPVKCNHYYDSVVLMKDPISCQEKLYFHCGRCSHEEIIPIKDGLLYELVMKGGTP